MLKRSRVKVNLFIGSSKILVSFISHIVMVDSIEKMDLWKKVQEDRRVSLGPSAGRRVWAARKVEEKSRDRCTKTCLFR